MRAAIAGVLVVVACPALADDCHERLTAAFATLNDNGPHRIVMVTQEPTGSQTIAMDVVPGVGIAAEMEALGSTEKLIIVGDKGWIDRDGDWIEMDPKMVTFFGSTVDVSAPMIRSAMTNVACVAGGFSFEIPGAKPVSSVTVGLDAGGRVSTLTGSIEGVAVEIAYSYDATITVSPPVAR